MKSSPGSWQNKDEFELIFKRYYESLCTYVFSVVKDADLSEDIVQDLFVKLWLNRANTDVSISLKAYLYRAARNAALNQIKHHDIKEIHKKQNRLDMVFAEENMGDALEETELSEKIKASIAKLPAERQKIFLLSRDEGKKYKEIAEELNISIKTVENQMGKALSALRIDLSLYLPLVVVLFLLGIK